MDTVVLARDIIWHGNTPLPSYTVQAVRNFIAFDPQSVKTKFMTKKNTCTTFGGRGRSRRGLGVPQYPF